MEKFKDPVHQREGQSKEEEVGWWRWRCLQEQVAASEPNELYRCLCDAQDISLQLESK